MQCQLLSSMTHLIRAVIKELGPHAGPQDRFQCLNFRIFEEHLCWLRLISFHRKQVFRHCESLLQCHPHRLVSSALAYPPRVALSC